MQKIINLELALPLFNLIIDAITFVLNHHDEFIMETNRDSKALNALEHFRQHFSNVGNVDTLSIESKKIVN